MKKSLAVQFLLCLTLVLFLAAPAAAIKQCWMCDEDDPGWLPCVCGSVTATCRTCQQAAEVAFLAPLDEENPASPTAAETNAPSCQAPRPAEGR